MSAPKLTSLIRAAAAAGSLCLTLNALPAMAQSYHVTDHWKLEGNPRWDYALVDAPAHTLYVTQGAQVTVINTETGKTVNVIGDLKGTHGVALDAIDKYGYISDGGANAVVVFDRHTYAKVMSIPAGTNPDGIAYEPVTKTVWAFNGRSKNATVIDTTTNKVVATIDLPGKPEFPAADGKGTVFVNIEDKNQIVRLDAASKTATATWPLNCQSPSGLAMDKSSRRLYSVCDEKKMNVLDADTGKNVATVPIGDGPDAAGFDAEKKLIFSSNGEDGTLTVVHEDSPDKYTVVETVPTQKSARTMALDVKTGRVYLASAVMGPRPAPTPDNPRGWPKAEPGSFAVIVVSPK